MNTITYDDCYDLGLLNNYTLLSKTFRHINTPLNWICNKCNNKFMQTYNNIKNYNKGCLKCVYKKYNKRNCK
jgi:hypothetical protein